MSAIVPLLAGNTHTWFDGVQEWFADWEHEASKPCEALHGPSRAAWHLVIWGAQGCNPDLYLTEIPQNWPTASASQH